MLPTRFSFSGLSWLMTEVGIDFFCFIFSKNGIRRPSMEWGLSPVNERFLVIRMVAILSNQLAQFGCYYMYKADKQMGSRTF